MRKPSNVTPSHMSRGLCLFHEYLVYRNEQIGAFRFLRQDRTIGNRIRPRQRNLYVAFVDDEAARPTRRCTLCESIVYDAMPIESSALARPNK